MTMITPLTTTKHLQLRVKESSDYRKFAAENLVPIVVQEFTTLATEFPLVYVKNTETGQFMPVALMGIKNGLNLYCQSAQWNATVTPLGFRSAPFSFVKTAKENDELMLCVDEDSTLISSEQGTRLFDDQGNQSDYLKMRAEALLDIASFNQQTKDITALFVEMQLLVPQQLTVKLGSNEPKMNIDGVYVIDEKRLNDLSQDDFMSLKSKGLLPIIYAHRISLQQIAKLIFKQNEFDNQPK